MNNIAAAHRDSAAITLRKLLAVVNPCGGTRRGAAILGQVGPLFEAAGVRLDICLTQRAGHAREIAREADLIGYDGLCVLGGDGTIHEVADGLMARSAGDVIPLGLIPAGSGNSMHQHLGCVDPLEAARRILAGKTLPLDVMRVTMGANVIHCVNIVGWGAVAEINATAESLRWLGPMRYALAAMRHILCARPQQARITLDSQTLEGEFLLAIACNAAFTGKGMKAAPHADLGDGKIDVIVVRRASRLQLARLFTKIFDGSHLAMDCVEYYQTASLAIESDSRRLLNLDGEMKGRPPFDLQVLPGALRVFGYKASWNACCF